MFWIPFIALSALASPNEPVRVVGGTPVSPGDWPDAVALYNSAGPYCSGVLIAPDLVVTAGHCESNPRSVRLNLTDLSTDDGLTLQVTESWVYPDYLTTLDLMLLRLEAPVDIPPRALALDCLADNYLVNDQRVQIVGFGAIDLNGLEQPGLLMEAETHIVDATCSSPGKDCNPDVVPYGELIAGGEGIDSCVRDSGGPLYARTPNGDLLTGLTSRGIKPAATSCGVGGIYVRADAIVSWVEEQSGTTLTRPDCAALGLNSKPAPTVETLIALDGVGSVYVNPNDPNPDDTHSYAIETPPTWGEADIDENGRLTYSGPYLETLEDALVVSVTDDGAPPMTEHVEVSILLETAPFEDPGGCACTSARLSPIFSWLWVGIPLVLCHHRRQIRRRN